MPEPFLNYWQQERSRLEQQLRRAQGLGMESHELTWLHRLRRIVDDQFARWSQDLAGEHGAA